MFILEILHRITAILLCPITWDNALITELWTPHLEVELYLIETIIVKVNNFKDLILKLGPTQFKYFLQFLLPHKHLQRNIWI